MVADTDHAAQDGIPLTLLTGFLGAGKTTLLAHVLRAPNAARIAVLVNDVDGAALDHALLERVPDEALQLTAGCLCCAGRSELADAIARLATRSPARIVLELAGSADPAPILHALATDARLRALVVPAGVVTVVDVPRAEESTRVHPEARRQLELADRVVLTKADLAPERLADVRACVARAAPGAEVREAVAGRIDPAFVLAGPCLPRVRSIDDAREWLHHGERAASFTTRVAHVAGAAREDVLQLWLRLVTQLDGDRLLRVKLVAECAATGGAFVLQAVGATVSPPRRLARRPVGMHGVHALLVARGLPEATLASMLDALRAAVAGTRADASDVVG